MPDADEAAFDREQDRKLKALAIAEEKVDIRRKQIENRHRVLELIAKQSELESKGILAPGRLPALTDNAQAAADAA